MKVGIISEYDIDLIDGLRFLPFEFFYFSLNEIEKRRINNIFLLSFEELKNFYDEVDIIINLSDNNFELKKVINVIDDINLAQKDKVYVYRKEKVFLDNIIYFPFVINDEIVRKDKIENLYQLKQKNSLLILTEKLTFEIIGLITSLLEDFEIFIYGIFNENVSNSKNIRFIKKNLERNELIKLLKYVDIILDFSKNKFYREILYAAVLNKPVLTIKKFKNFLELRIDENLKNNIFKLINKKFHYDVDDFLLKNFKKIVEKELSSIVLEKINI
ncbi:MAG: hypothetical protein QXL82_00895 [Candidatus Aenigmatarchaeota archaeon]